MRDYEKAHGLKYSTELASILEKGSFINHHKEEFFILDEYALFEPDEVINIIEVKVMDTITVLNNDPNKDETYFKSILTKYYEKIIQNDIDKFERKKLLERAIKSPRLSLILKMIWK